MPVVHAADDLKRAQADCGVLPEDALYGHPDTQKSRRGICAELHGDELQFQIHCSNIDRVLYVPKVV